MPGLKPVSDETVIKILTKEYQFAVSGQSGSHVRLSKATAGGECDCPAGQELEHPEGARWEQLSRSVGS